MYKTELNALKFKTPNPYCKNKEMDKNICVNCGEKDCFLGFNAFPKDKKEMRIDFVGCNLACTLCWSDNCDTSFTAIEVDKLIERIEKCLKSNYENNGRHITSLQIIGGEPLNGIANFVYIKEFLEKLDNLLENNSNTYATKLCGIGKKDKYNQEKFVVKIFTNGISIGKNEISLEDIKKFSGYKRIRTKILFSLKGLNFQEFQELNGLKGEDFKYQVEAMKKLAKLSYEDIHQLGIQVVLGLYHNDSYSIKTQSIKAEEMFRFRDDDKLSQELKEAIKTYMKKWGRFFMEKAKVDDSIPSIRKGIVNKEDYRTTSFMENFHYSEDFPNKNKIELCQAEKLYKHFKENNIDYPMKRKDYPNYKTILSKHS